MSDDARIQECVGCGASVTVRLLHRPERFTFDHLTHPREKPHEARCWQAPLCAVCWRRRRAAKTFLPCGVPLKAIADIVDDSFAPVGESARLRDLIEQLILGQISERWLLVSGAPGTGKTTEAARAIMRHGDRRNRLVTIADLADRLKSSFAKDSRTDETSVLAEYAGAPLLVLDDLGAERATEYVVSALGTIIDRRYRVGALMIITTNLSSISDVVGHLAPKGGELQAQRIVDRINELARVKELTIATFRTRAAQRHPAWDRLALNAPSPSRPRYFMKFDVDCPTVEDIETGAYFNDLEALLTEQARYNSVGSLALAHEGD